MTNKELELIEQLTEVAMTVAELKAENKILKDINEKLNQALRKTDVAGQAEQLVCEYCNDDTKPTCCDSCLERMVNAVQKAN